MADTSLQCGDNLAPRHVKNVVINKYLHDSVYITILEPGNIVAPPLKIKFFACFILGLIIAL